MLRNKIVTISMCSVAEEPSVVSVHVGCQLPLPPLGLTCYLRRRVHDSCRRHFMAGSAITVTASARRSAISTTGVKESTCSSLVSSSLPSNLGIHLGFG